MGVRDLLSLFLEMSALKGEWAAALQALPTASSSSLQPTHALLLSEAFSNGGKWAEGLAYCRPYHAEQSTRAHYVRCLSSVLASYSEAVQDSQKFSWQFALGVATDAWKGVESCQLPFEATVEAQKLWSCCETHVLPRLPGAARTGSYDEWKQILVKMTQLHSDSFQPVEQQAEHQDSRPSAAAPPLSSTSHPNHQEGGADHTVESQLRELLQQPKSRDTWRTAVEIFMSNADNNLMSFTSFDIVLQCLSRQGRVSEAVRVISMCCLQDPPILRPSRRVVTSIAHFAKTTRSAELCRLVLSHVSLAAQLTPTAAIELLSVLSVPYVAQSHWQLVDDWWSRLKSEESEGSYSLRTHINVSSYVGVCIAQGTRHQEWERAIQAFVSSRSTDPDRALLCQLRLLRTAKQWKAAMSLFSKRLSEEDDRWNTRALRDSHKLLTKENASQWIPQAAIQVVDAAFQASQHR